MPSPTPYSLAYDFTAFQASNPTTPLPADRVEIEYNSISTSVTSIITNLALIQRSDGALVNGVVTVEALSDTVEALIGAGTGDVAIVADNIDDIVTVAADLDGVDTIGSVSTNIANINTVAGMSSSISTVVGMSSAITTVNSNSTNINIVSSNITNINTVAGISTSVSQIAEQVLTALRWTFSSTTTMADPGTGSLRLNNATLSSVSAIAVDDLTSQTGNPDLSGFVLTWDDSDSSVKGTLKLTKIDNPAVFAVYNVTGLTDNAGWTQLNVSYVTHAGSFTNGQDIFVQFTRAGDKGSAGAGTGDMLKTENLSGLSNYTTARFNMGLGSLATLSTVNGGNWSGTDLAVVDGGTGLSAGTSGGVPYFSGTTSMASSAALTNNAFVLGGGAGTAPKVVAGLATDGTSQVQLGVAGTSVGSLRVSNATSGNITLQPVTGSLGSAVITIPALTGVMKVTGKETIWVGANSMTPATTNGPSTASLEAGTNKQNYEVLDFDGTTAESAHFQIALPKSWNNGTVTFQVYWSTTASDTSGVAWQLQAVSFADNDAIDTAFGTGIVVTDAVQSSSGRVLITAESSAVTIAGSPASGEVQFFRLSREPSNGSDTMTQDARLIGIKLFFTSNAAEDT